MNLPRLCWQDHGLPRSALWHSERDEPPPARVQVVDDRCKADAACRLAAEGTALLWQGDFHNARQLLLAMARRLDRRAARPGPACPAAAEAPGAAFHRHRQAQAQRARVLSQLLMPLQADYSCPLRRAPDHRQAIAEAWGVPPADAGRRGAGEAALACEAGSAGEVEPAGEAELAAERTARAPDDIAHVLPLRELLGLVSAHEWRKKGVPVAALGGAPIHPHHGVFSPVRGEYVDLVAQAPLPAPAAVLTAFDIGTGTGVLAAVLARRGVAKVVATDLAPRALACAQDNLARLGLSARVELLAADLFPPGRADLVLCNPPWVPARPGAPIERAVYDEDSRMLRGYLAGLAAHLTPGGEGWLILSDLAEHLGLRTREELLGWVDAAGLRVRGRLDTRPTHRKAGDASDPLHAARAAEVTSLWRLGVRHAT